MLTPAVHVINAGIATRDFPYAWDEWRIREYYMGIQEDQFHRLDALTNNANMGLTIAAGEWVCHRFSALSNDATPLKFLEAAWAGMIHPAYCIYTETVDDQWRGPIREPLAVTIAIANDALFCLGDDPHVARRACWMYNLARHVLPSKDAFELWFEFCVKRLERHHTKSIEARIGDTDLFENFSDQGMPVPREAFDSAFPYDPAQAPRLLDSFLRGLNQNANPYLRNANELMRAADLPGSPYRYVP